jgi:hypothetical protein
MTLLTAEMRSMVGTSRTYRAPEAFGEAAARYFALAIGDSNPMYAEKKILPPTLLCETNQYANLPINEDGYAGHLWQLDIPGTRLLRGGNSYRFYQYAKTSDVVTAVWTIDDISERVNSRGMSIVTMLSSASYRNQNDELIATNSETLFWLEIVGQK